MKQYYFRLFLVPVIALMSFTLNAQIQKAQYSVKNLDSLLAKKVIYPLDALRNSDEGDVIISFSVTKDGKLENPGIVKTSNFLLSKTSLDAVKWINERWVPAKDGDIPISKKYLVVFRYRIYFNSSPPKYKPGAEKQYNKGNYPKALKIYDDAIEENPYDKDLFFARSKTKEALGDTAGAANDIAEYNRLNEEIMAVVDIYAIATQKTVVRTVNSTVRTM
ncbi:MAG: TonB family protein [Bacteroidetes bacterium]|nr:TonB family protein [Bacteroidota bacterium]